MSIYAKGNDIARIEAFYAVQLREHHMAQHTHARCEVMYVTAGSCTIEVEGELFRLRKRECVFLDQEVRHSLLVEEEPCALLNLEFSVSNSGSGLSFRELRDGCAEWTVFLQKEEPYAFLRDEQKLGFALKDLIDELEGRRSGSETMIHLLFQRFLLELCRCPAISGGRSGAVHLNKAAAFIEEHFAEELNVAAIASAAGVHSAYLQTLFAKRFGCGMMAYANKKRMDLAAFLLINSDRSVTDIAYASGLNSRQHFGYLFHKYFQMSPRQYRQLHQQLLLPDTGLAQRLAEADGSYRSITLHAR